MSGRIRSRLPHPWLLVLCIAASLLAPTSASAITSKQCDARVNDTAAKLLPCIQQGDLWNHMQAFQAIADANPGPDGHASRNSGEPGYRASALYVKDKMEAAGYGGKIRTYKFASSWFVGTPAWSESGPTPRDFQLVNDWNPGTSNG